MLGSNFQIRNLLVQGGCLPTNWRWWLPQRECLFLTIRWDWSLILTVMDYSGLTMEMSRARRTLTALSLSASHKFGAIKVVYNG